MFSQHNDNSLIDQHGVEERGLNFESGGTSMNHTSETASYVQQASENL